LELNSLNWFSLTSEQGLSFNQPEQNNGELRLNIYFPDPAIVNPPAGTSMLTTWNSGTPNLPAGFTATISKLAANLAGPQSTPPSAQPQTTSATAVTTALVGLVKGQQLSPGFLIGAFLLSLALGSLHAMTPGHGKALVGAYLVGSHGRPRDAVFLGTIVTITHTGSVLLLGAITLIASHYILPTLVAPWLEIISGLLIIGFGISLLLQRRRDLASWLAGERTKKSNKNSRWIRVREARSITTTQAHSHTTGLLHHHHPSHDKGERHNRSHPEDLTHEHSHIPPSSQVTWRSLLALGVSGGLIPCPDAIAILLVAVAVNRIPFGMLLIVAFSIGLALVLIGIGIALVQGVRLIARSDLLNRLSVFAPMISAVVVLGLGIGLTASSFNSLKFSSTVSQSSVNQRVPSSSNSPIPIFDITSAKLLYVAQDAKGRGQLFMIPFSGGSPIQYTQEPTGISGYSISPDHKTILYTIFKPDISTSIWMISADGTQRRLVLDCPQAECDSPQWYPDSQKAVYERLDVSQDSSMPRYSLWWLDISTGKTQPVFQDQMFASAAPRFSPDGQWLSYVSPVNNAILIYHLKDARGISIPLGNQPIIPESWSPTSDSILFGDQVKSQDGIPLHIKRYFLDSGQIIDLGGSNDQTDYSAAWSPDGNWIAIDRDIPGSDSGKVPNQVWLVKPDGTQSHVFLNADNVYYSDLKWSPDGRFLIYSRYSYPSASQNQGRFDIYMADIPSGQETLLAPGGDLPGILP
jgi:ABC-type nickel/cobalt efflux system permease component RcnA